MQIGGQKEGGGVLWLTIALKERGTRKFILVTGSMTMTGEDDSGRQDIPVIRRCRSLLKVESNNKIQKTI